MKPDAEILAALVRWVEASERSPGELVLLELQIDRPCPLCGGSRFCPEGCPMAVGRLDYEVAHWRRLQPIREHEYRMRGDEGWDEALVSGRECAACNVYGYCISCNPSGQERRRAHKAGGAFLVDSVPLYSKTGHEMTDPITVTKAQVRRSLKACQDPQLDLLGAAA